MWLVDLKYISISSGTGGKELPRSCNFLVRFFYFLPPKRDFPSTRITPKCLNSAVLTGKLIRALTPTLCPNYCFPAGLQAQSVPHDSEWGVIAALVVGAQEGVRVRLCAQGADCRDNKDMKVCTKRNQEGATPGCSGRTRY